MLAGVVGVLGAVLGVPGISERVGGAAAERVPLRLPTLLRVGVLGGGEVSRGGGSVVARAGIVRVRSYADISNIRIVNTWILYLLGRRSSRITGKS